MSGHSKWNSIKHRKAAQDARRGKLFTKLIREITVAARQGGADADANPRLRLAVVQARSHNIPGETIQRAITKGAGGTDGAHYEEVIYEGYGPHRVAVVVEALTDNRKRTAASLRHAFNRHHGGLGATNSVQYMFERKGTLTVPHHAIDEDTLTEYILEAGAEDLENLGEAYLVITPVTRFDAVRTFLEEKGVRIEAAELQRLPQNRVSIESKEEAERVLTFLEALEEDDDVQKVFSNFEIDEAIIADLA